MLKDKLKGIKAEHVLFALVIAFCYLLTYHPDIHETSNHTYLLLDSIFSGNFLDFYGYVDSRPLEIYYLNTANYNIVVYLLFAVWQLPLFIVSALFSLPMNEYLFMTYTKALCVLFYLGCGYMVKKLGVRLSLGEVHSTAAALFFLFNPIAFFSPVVMGQYDAIGLFFILLALYYYLVGDMRRFALFMGVGGVFKFFAFLVFIPLLLLKEKRIIKILLYSLLSMFLYLPTTLLFLGRMSGSSVFLGQIFERFLSSTLSVGFADLSLFLLIYAVLCFYCFLRKKSEDIGYISVYLPLLVFALLLFFINWHPQWFLYLIPFSVLTAFLQKNRIPWWIVDIIMCFGFFATCFIEFPNQTGANIFAGPGLLLEKITGVGWHLAPSFQSVGYFISLVPEFLQIVPLCLSASLFVNILFKLPIKGESLGDKLSDGEGFDKISYRLAGYTIFIVGFGVCWFLPSLFEYLNAFNIV